MYRYVFHNYVSAYITRLFIIHSLLYTTYTQSKAMQSSFLTFLCIGCLIIKKVTCDYVCLCSYQVELEIFEKPDSSSNVDGYMYEFDCKPSYNINGLDPAYKAVGNEGKVLGFSLRIKTLKK